MGCNNVARGIKTTTLPQRFGAPTGVLPGMGKVLALKANPSRNFLPLSETPEAEPGSRREGLGSGSSPGRGDHPMGLGGRSCSHAQGTANVCPLRRQEGIFPPGQTGTCLQDFFFFLLLQCWAELLARALQWWFWWVPACCSCGNYMMLFHHEDAVGALSLLSGKIFFPLGRLTLLLGDIFPSLAALSTAPYQAFLWPVLAKSLPAVLAAWRCHRCPGFLSSCTCIQEKCYLSLVCVVTCAGVGLRTLSCSSALGNGT